MNKERIYSLDALKFFAAIFIVFHHFQQDMRIRFVGINFFGEGTYFGYLVELFFIISGYLVAKGCKYMKKATFKEFFVKKCVRIYPMAFLATGTYCVLSWLYYGLVGNWFDEVEIDIWNAIASLMLISHGSFVRNITIAANNPIWYLCVLLICYVILWTLSKFSERSGLAIEYLCVAMVLLGVGVRIVGVDWPFFNYYTARGYMSFFLGVLISQLLKKCGEREKQYLKVGAGVALLVAGVLVIKGQVVVALFFDSWFGINHASI